jgi:hypothetical protein
VGCHEGGIQYNPWRHVHFSEETTEISSLADEEKYTSRRKGLLRGFMSINAQQAVVAYVFPLS